MDPHTRHAYSQQGSFKMSSNDITYTYSKALDNAGEFFFSAPINIRRYYSFAGRSGKVAVGTARAMASN